MDRQLAGDPGGAARLVDRGRAAMDDTMCHGMHRLIHPLRVTPEHSLDHLESRHAA